MRTNYFAIVSKDDGVLWGCGTSEPAAWADAKQYIDAYSDDPGFSYDDFHAERMTKRFFDHLQKHDLVGLQYGPNDDDLLDILN